MTGTMTQDKLLSVTPLQLSSSIDEVRDAHGAIILKHRPSQSYLVVDQAQMRILQYFREPMRMDELVPRLISLRSCPPLKNLYELILKAEQSGVLVNTLEPRKFKTVEPCDWSLELGSTTAEIVSVSCIVFGFFGLVFGHVGVPRNVAEIVWGYSAIALALSLGQVLAGCVLRGHGCEVYSPRLHWRTLVPHFRIDTDDAMMGGRNCRTNVALMRMAPMFLLSGLAAFFYSPIQFILLLGIFLVTLPVSGSPAVHLISSVYRRMPLCTQEDFLFIRNRLAWAALNARMRFLDKRYLLILGGYTIVWIGLFFGATAQVFDINGLRLLQRLYDQGGLDARGWIILVLIGFFVLVTVSLAVFLIIKNIEGVSHQLPHRNSRKKRRTAQLSSQGQHEAIAVTLGDSLLFRELNEQNRLEVARRMKVIQFKRREFIIKMGTHGEELYVVHEGRVEVLMTSGSGKLMKITELGPADVFGEIALIEAVPRTRSIRAVRPTTLLTLSKADFEELVLTVLDAGRVKEIVQKRAFLNRIELCRNWHPQAMVRFARIASFSSYKAGEVIIRDGSDNRFFFLIYEGLLEVRKGRKVIKKLGTGEFFGEISLLRNNLSTADVVAVEDSRCLTVHKSEFLKFFSSDFLIGLQFEEIGTKRLREPLFSEPVAAIT